MSGWWTKFRRHDGGAIAIEFAFYIPILLTLFVGVVEFARYVQYGGAIERGLRIGAMVAARSPLPLDVAHLTLINNAVTTGDTLGGSVLMLEGWADEAASLTVIPRIEVIDGNNVTIIRLEASVPYSSLAPGLLDYIGLPNLTVRMAHEQAYIGG